MSIPRDFQGIFRKVYDDTTQCLRVDVGSSTGGVTLSVSDIQIGAVELKDHTTNDRVHVTPDNKQYVRAVDIEAILNLIKDIDGIKKIIDDVNVNLQDGTGIDLTSTLLTGKRALDVNVAGGSINVMPAPPRSVETDSATASDLGFTSGTEITDYNIVFIGVARTGGIEDFELDISIKRGLVLHPIFKSKKFKDFVSITDILKVTSGEVLVVTTTGITASTVDLTVIKEVS